MSASPNPPPVIDVDSHWTEPADLWTSRAPARLKGRALRVQRDDQGVERWVVEDGQVMGQVGYCSIRPDGSKSQASIAFDSFDEVHPGAIAVEPRLDYMDEHGLHYAVHDVANQWEGKSGCDEHHHPGVTTHLGLNCAGRK